MIESPSLKQLYEEIVNSKEELKSFIEASEVKILLKFNLINGKVRKWQEENYLLKERIEIMERE